MISIEVFAGMVTKSTCLGVKTRIQDEVDLTHKLATYLAADGSRVFWEVTH